MNMSVVALIRSAKALKMSVVALIRSAETLNRSAEALNRSVVALVPIYSRSSLKKSCNYMLFKTFYRGLTSFILFSKSILMTVIYSCISTCSSHITIMH